jgi:hypothetical protein
MRQASGSNAAARAAITIRSQLESMGNAFTVRIAGATLPVFGSTENGWDISFSDDQRPNRYRYGNLDELAFALINLSVADDGNA